MARTLVFGDIHGCHIALNGALAAAAPASDDVFVFLGDYVDRGADSCGVLDTLLGLHQTGQAVFLLGNHESMMLEALETGDDTFWLTVGGRETMASYRRCPDGDERIKRHVAFLTEQCRLYYTTETEAFVHGSVIPSLALEDTPPHVMVWSRFNDPAPHISGKRVITGHTPQRDGVPRDIGHAVCIDTYCYGGGYVTCLDVTNDIVYQGNEAGEERNFPLSAATGVLGPLPLDPEITSS